jgi:propanediol dehydratase large subunit
MEDVNMAVKILLDGIQKQRDEILQAFIAKHGCEPDECEQVIIADTSSVIRWFVRKKPLKEDL